MTKRYRIECGRYSIEYHEDPNGPFVGYADHEHALTEKDQVIQQQRELLESSAKEISTLQAQSRELAFLNEVSERHRGREKYMAEIVFQPIKHGDEKHQEWLRGALVEALCREDTKACMTFDDLRLKLADQARELERLQGELKQCDELKHAYELESRKAYSRAAHAEIDLKHSNFDYQKLLETAVRLARNSLCSFETCPMGKCTEARAFLATPAAMAVQQAKEET